MHSVSVRTREVGSVTRNSITYACQQTQIMDGENVMKSGMESRGSLR